MDTLIQTIVYGPYIAMIQYRIYVDGPLQLLLLARCCLVALGFLRQLLRQSAGKPLSGRKLNQKGHFLQKEIP